MKTLLLILRTKLFLFGLLFTCTFILANNYIQRKDPFTFTEVKENIVAKPENSAIAKKKLAKQKMNLQLQGNSFRDADVSFTATVTSDKLDYAPTSTAIFTGLGFLPNENVVLKVKNLDQPCNTVSADSSYLPWTVTADANGDFVTAWTVCDCPGDSLRLKATGQTSGQIAYVYFSDAPNDFTISVSPTTLCPNKTVTLTFTVGITGTNESCFQLSIPEGYTSASAAFVSATGGKNWTPSISGSTINVSADRKSVV